METCFLHRALLCPGHIGLWSKAQHQNEETGAIFEALLTFPAPAIAKSSKVTSEGI